MYANFKEFHNSVVKMREGNDPLNLNNLTFLRKNENVDDYIKRVQEHLKWQAYKSNYDILVTNYQQLLDNNRKKKKGRVQIPLGFMKSLPKAENLNLYRTLIRHVSESPFYKDFSIGVILYNNAVFGLAFHWESLNVFNYKHKTNHKITDLYFVARPGHSFYGFRGSLSAIEVSIGYRHSHLHTRNIDEYNRNEVLVNQFCLGSSTIVNYTGHVLFNSSLKQDTVDGFLLQLNDYVRTESTEGTPYIHFQKLYNSLGSTVFPIKSNLTPVLPILKNYCNFKFNNGVISVDLDPKVANEPKIISYFGESSDENGNKVISASYTSEIKYRIIGPKITNRINITKPEVKLRLPSNFVLQLTNLITNESNKFNTKETIFTSFNSTRNQDTSVSKQEPVKRNKIHVVEV